MPTYLSPTPRVLIFLVAVVLLVSIIMTFGSRAEVATAQVVEQHFIRKIDFLANDLAVDPATQAILASVPSIAGANGNSITEINPATGVIGPSVFIGSEPNMMGSSNNGQKIYAILDGSKSIRRFDVPSRTAELSFSLGTDNFGVIAPFHLAVQPGNPGTIAVTTDRGSLVLLDNGVQRGERLPFNLKLAFDGADPSRLYGLGSGLLRRMLITANGVSFLNEFQVFADGAIKYSEGRLYAASGQVLNPDTGALLGTFTGTNISTFTPFVIDANVDRAYFIASSFAFPNQSATATLRVFDTGTFTALGTLDIPILGAPTSLVRWGSNGLAFSTTGGQVFIIQTTLIPSADPIPTPTPTPSPTPTPTPIPTPLAGELRQISLATNDLVVDPNSDTIFASVPSIAGAGGNSLTPINPVTGNLGTPVFVGSEPNKLAISDGGEAIYVGLDGADAIRRFDVPSQTPGLQFAVGSDPISGSFRAGDITVMPGNPGVIAVARIRPSVSPRAHGVAIFDNGVQRPTVTPTNQLIEAIEFSKSPQVLYGQNTESTENGFRKMAVGSCGVVTMSTTEGLIGGFNFDIKEDNGIVFSSLGQAVDPETPARLGRFALTQPNTAPASIPTVAPEVKAGRIYFVLDENGTTLLRVYSTKTFLKIGELRLPGVTGTFSSLARWGAHGLAFRNNAGQVFLLENDLIGGQDPQFVPSPPPPPPLGTTKVQVSSFNGDPSEVTLQLTGSLNTSGVTDSTGKLTINGVPPCGSLTVTPSKTNYTFSPASITSASPVNATLNFSATLRTLAFSATIVNANESVGKLVAFVTKNTTATEVSTVEFETVSNTASERSDFNTTLGKLEFAPNEFTKSITLLITDDTLVEGPESFTVRLKNPTGAALLPTTSTLTVNIVDNDLTAGLPNPLSNAQFFVRQHYQDFLNRAASDDVSGSNFWVSEITGCNSEPDPVKRGQCLAIKRINVSAAFFLSIEFKETGYLVHRFYRTSFPPSAARPLGLPRYLEFLRDTQQIGKGVVVGAPGWEQTLEQNKQAFALAWVNKADFLAEHPVSQTAQQFVDSLFQNTGVAPSAAERTAAITAFGAGGAAGRAAALRSVAESQSVFQGEFNSAFVLMQYFGYLRRNPDDAPDTNFDGYLFWLAKLNQFNGNFIQAEMVKAFLLSLEYQHRFGAANFVLEQ